MSGLVSALFLRSIYPTRSYVAIVLSYCLCMLTSLSLAAASVQADELQTIRDAWDQRHDAIKSFHYECDLEETSLAMLAILKEISSPDEPQIEGAEQVPIMLLSNLSYSMANGKFALSIVEESSDARVKETHPKSEWKLFNGKDLLTLMKQREKYWAIVDVGIDPLLSTIVQNTKVIPLWLWYSPKTFLSTSAYLLDNAQITGRNIRVRGPDGKGEGTECIELTIQQKDATIVSSLYLDPSRDYLPLKLIERLNGLTIRRELTFEYAPHDRVGWVVSKWKNGYFDNSGELEMTYSGKVRSVTVVNEPLDEKLFTLEFPVGTQIFERKDGGTKIYIQDADGKRRQVEKEELRKISEKGESLRHSQTASSQAL